MASLLAGGRESCVRRRGRDVERPVMSTDELLRTAQESCEACLRRGEPASVLDAGSGLSSHVAFPADVHVTGIDIVKDLLDANARLDERIHADLGVVELGERKFDCIVCWDVLEHLDRPAEVVAKLARAVAPSGVLVIGSPDPASVKGLVTRLTPHRVHLWIYRRFFNPAATAEPGKGPYRTFMRRDVRPERVIRVAGDAGLRCSYCAWTESAMQIALRSRVAIVGRPWRALRRAVCKGTGGRVDPAATDYLCIFTNPEEPEKLGGDEVVDASTKGPSVTR